MVGSSTFWATTASSGRLHLVSMAMWLSVKIRYPKKWDREYSKLLGFLSGLQFGPYPLQHLIVSHKVSPWICPKVLGFSVILMDIMVFMWDFLVGRWMFHDVSSCFHRFKDVKDKRWLQLSTTSNSRFPHCCAGPLEVASDATVEIRGPRGDRFGTLEKGHDATCPGQKWINPSTKIWGSCSVGRYHLLFFVSCFFFHLFLCGCFESEFFFPSKVVHAPCWGTLGPSRLHDEWTDGCHGPIADGGHRDVHAHRLWADGGLLKHVETGRPLVVDGGSILNGRIGNIHCW